MIVARRVLIDAVPVVHRLRAADALGFLAGRRLRRFRALLIAAVDPVDGHLHGAVRP